MKSSLLIAQTPWTRRGFFVLTAALLTAGCGGSDKDSPTDTQDTQEDTQSDTGDTQPVASDCMTRFVHTPFGSPDSVRVAGPFNEWVGSEMIEQQDGTWSVDLDLEAGAHPYKFIESTGGEDAWTCDPSADLIQCDEGYKNTNDTSWTHSCGLNQESCNSMIRVESCEVPTLKLSSLDIDRENLAIQADAVVTLANSASPVSITSVTLNGESIDATWSGRRLSMEARDLEAGRHTLRVQVTDQDGQSSEELHIPFWLDSRDWEGGLMYYAFTDRVSDGDTSLNQSEGATHELGSYMGGDYAGLIGLLGYLDDLGVNVLWIANPQDNAEGAFNSDCGTYSGYHGYWPDDAKEAEEHFGGSEGLHNLVEEAHKRGMRVVMDWVVNHVHEDHPYYEDYADDGWFNELETCKVGEDYSNFDRIPETCWFAEYLPDFRFYEPEPLDQLVEDAIWWAKTYNLDGFRVDGAKHVPHSVPYNLATRLRHELEHSDAGGDEDFYTVGETFSFDRNWISLYIGEDQLDAQFDFPLYGSLRAALIDNSIRLPDLFASRATSDAAYGDAIMSQFLGNHDVSRFVSQAASGSWADSADSACETAEPPQDPQIYERLNLAWTFLMTQPGLPLIYYGDEMGIPGYRDPSNRAPLWWYSSSVNTAGADLNAMVDGLVYPDSHASVLRHVAALGQARANHPVLFGGSSTEWWQEDDIYAFARSQDEAHLLVALNRSASDRTLTNSLSFAGLPTDGQWTDLLTGETFQAQNDTLDLTVSARSSRVLLRDSD